MAKRRAKRTVKKLTSTVDNGNVSGELQVEKQLQAMSDREVQRLITAIQAIRDAENEHLLTQLRLLRSYFSKDQLETPALQFFKDNFPNLSITLNENEDLFDLEWKAKDGNVPVNDDNERNACASLPHQTSIAYPPDCITAMPDINGFNFSTQAVKASFLGAASLQIPDFILEETSEALKLGFQDTLQTPGVTSQRLSIGITPKTNRLPKHGEILLSVHGSPLGVYREDNMEAIHESQEE